VDDSPPPLTLSNVGVFLSSSEKVRRLPIFLRTTADSALNSTQPSGLCTFV
jgi:hypothetical protein